MLNLIVLALTCATNLLLGSLVLARSPKLKSSQAFFLMSLFISCWAVTNYFTDHIRSSIELNNVNNRFAYFFAFLALAFGLRFVVNFIEPVYLGFGRHADRFFAVAGGVIAILSLSPLVAGQVHKNGDNLAFTIGPLLPLYAIIAVVFIGLVMATLLRIMKIRKGREKQQAFYILIGFTATPLIVLLTNIILPNINSNWHTTTIGPLFTIILVGVVAYAIVKHRLFDIRFVVVRSLAYVLSVGAIVAIYVLIAIGLLNTIFNFNISTREEIVFALFSVVTAFFFQPLKKFFDKSTNKLFYQDAYDPRVFFDELNKVIVSNIEIDKLLSESSRVIASNLKSEYCAIGVEDGTDTGFRIVGTSTKMQNSDDIQRFRHLRLESHERVIVADNLVENDNGFKELLVTNRISLVVRLVADTNMSSEGIGYIILGDKKSGNPYNDQDIKILDPISNELIIAVQNALRFEEIERFNETLQEKIEVATRQLRETNLKLKTIDRQKDDFISMASHQLRTPLTSIKGYVSLVLDGDSGRITATQRKLLEQAFTSSQRMVYLIADLLNVSRLKTGKFVIERVPTDLSKLINDEMAQLRTAASLHDIEIMFSPPQHFPVMQLDETKTRQVIMNFLDNAIYYTPKGGHITVNLRELPKSIEFEVVDDGIGVPQDERHHLFTKFYRAKNAQRARPDGTGLGLFMAKKVIVAQGGALIFDSKEGVGSKFGFSFPKDMPDDSAKPAVDKAVS